MSMVKDALIIQIRQNMSKAIDLKRKVDTAKTEAKKNVYAKKLKKNNLETADLFIALDKLVASEQAKLGDRNEVPIHEGRTPKAERNQQPVE